MDLQRVQHDSERKQAPRRQTGAARLVVQPKLRVGAVDDPAEVEADRIAESLTALFRRESHVDAAHGGPTDESAQRHFRIQRKGGVGGSEPVVGPAGRAGQAAPEPRIRRKIGADASGPAGGVVDEATESRIRSASGGQPLDGKVRPRFERALGSDLSGVRVHANSAVAPQIGAEAFTVGQDIHFAPGAYRPEHSDGQQLLGHELAHVIQQGGGREVQRKIGRNTPKDTFLALLEAVPQRRQLKNHIPSTGMGRFDAEYFHDRDELAITVRPYFEFCQTVAGGIATPGGWVKADEDKFVDDFRQQSVAAWSGKYSFVCTKPGFTEMRADVVIDVVREMDPAKAHFHHRIQKNKGMITGIGREQNDDPANINVGNFAEQDAPERPHDSKTTCGGIASHDVGRLQDLALAHHVNPITFTGGSRVNIDAGSKQRLDAFVAAVKRTERPGSVPVPLMVTGKSNRREALQRGNAGQDRANAVKAYLDGKGLRNTPCETRLFDDVVAAQEAVYKSKKSKLSKDAEKEKLDPLKARQDHREVELDVKEDFVWNGDPYSILAHEFGHMLGNPDEYFQYGSAAVRDAKVRQLQQSGNPEDLHLATKIAAQTVSGNESHSSAQEGMVALAERSGQELPEYGPKTSSIMSAGADVLPVHYAPLWEALSLITGDVVTRDEWSFV